MEITEQHDLFEEPVFTNFLADSSSNNPTPKMLSLSGPSFRCTIDQLTSKHVFMLAFAGFAG